MHRPGDIGVAAGASEMRGGAGSAALTSAINAIGFRKKFSAGTTIYAQHESAGYVYLVQSGLVRTERLFADGRRVVNEFYCLGEVFGLETGRQHSFSAEAATPCEVLMIDRGALFVRAGHDNALACQLWDVAATALARTQKRVVFLSRSAEERVAAFLLDMSSRLPDGTEIECEMSRRDMADYLGLTIETVSRTLTRLERSRVITRPTRRRIVVRDRVSLNELSE